MTETKILSSFGCPSFDLTALFFWLCWWTTRELRYETMMIAPAMTERVTGFSPSGLARMAALFFALMALFSPPPRSNLRMVLELLTIHVFAIGTYQFYLLNVTTPQACVVIPKKRKDAPGFWAKYRDDFAKQAVTALISAMIGGAVGFGFGRLNAAVTPTPAGQPVIQAQATSQPTTHP